MQMLTGISVLCVLCVGYACAQDEDFLGILDFDAYELDVRNEDLLRDKDIFRDDIEFQPTDRISEDAIRRLCDEYDLFLDNQNLDCSKIKLAQKSLKTDHNVQKREVAEDALEGSGGGDVENPPPKQEEPSQPEELPAPPPDAEQPEGINPLKEGEGSPAEENKEEPVEEPKEQEPAQEQIPEVATESPAVGEPEAATEGIQPAQEEPVAPPETATETPAAIIENVKENEAAQPDEAGPEHPKLDEAIEGTVEPETTTVRGPVKKGRKLLPGDIDASKPETDKTQDASQGDKTKETETLNEHQSGNAVVDNVDGKSLEGHERALNAMATNAKINTADGEEPKSGESAKEAEGGRKDTKVLIILFVAVVVIGAAAFAYNFIKKRKQKKDQVAREENGDGNALKRSLQNLSGQEKTDPEQGTELKPLMKNTEPKPVVAEYQDEKETVAAGAK